MERLIRLFSLVHADDLHLDDLAHAQDLGGILDELVGDLRDVHQAVLVNPHVHEDAEAGYVGHPAFEDHALLEMGHLGHVVTEFHGLEGRPRILARRPRARRGSPSPRQARSSRP